MAHTATTLLEQELEELASQYGWSISEGGAIHAFMERVRVQAVRVFIDSLPRKFWEDEDHGVGGYISKKDLVELAKEESR